MTNVRHRFVAVGAGVLMFFVAMGINFIGTDLLTAFLYQQRAGWIGSDTNWPLVIDYDRVGWVFLWAYPATVALATVGILWRGNPTEAKRALIYILLLAVVAPLTFINYYMNDQWLNMYVQAGFNVFVAFVGYSAVIYIQRLNTMAADAMAIQSLAVFGITALLVALPLFYSAIFIAVQLGFVRPEQLVAIDDAAPLVLAGGLASTVAFLGHLAKLRRDPDAANSQN